MVQSPRIPHMPQYLHSKYASRATGCVASAKGMRSICAMQNMRQLQAVMPACAIPWNSENTSQRCWQPEYSFSREKTSKRKLQSGHALQ